MKEVIVGLTVAAFSALCYIGYNHRRVYQNIYLSLFKLFVAIFLAFFIWDICVITVSHKLYPILLKDHFEISDKIYKLIRQNEVPSFYYWSMSGLMFSLIIIEYVLILIDRDKNKDNNTNKKMDS